MKTEVRYVPPELPEQTSTRLKDDVIKALGSVSTQGTQFVVNDTLWFQQTDRGINPAVVNSAAFITSKFQSTLSHRGWKKEARIEGQKIDGYIELPVSGGISFNKEKSIEILSVLFEENPDQDLGLLFSRIYQYYVKRNCFSSEGLPESIRAEFSPTHTPTSIRVALEFETGNIASLWYTIPSRTKLHLH